MKRYLVIDEPYGGNGIVGSVDSLDDIPGNHYDAVDTDTGIIYSNCGAGWEPGGEVADGCAVEEEDQQPEPEWTGAPYWCDPEKGNDANDGLDIGRPFKTLIAAIAASHKSPGRSKIFVKGREEKA